MLIWRQINQCWYTQTQINISFVVKHVSLIGYDNMENIEHGRPIEFIRHRRESQGYAKVRMMSLGGVQNILFKGLTIGPNRLG